MLTGKIAAKAVYPYYLGHDRRRLVMILFTCPFRSLRASAKCSFGFKRRLNFMGA